MIEEGHLEPSVVADVVARAEHGGTEEQRRAFVLELHGALGAGGAPWEMTTPAAEALGAALAEAGQTPAQAVRVMTGLARSLEEALEDRDLLPPEERRRLAPLVDRALAAALDAHDATRTRRRDGWLSFYTHELRNPLNTLVNAVWLLRNNSRPGQTQRICDMAERAVKKMEALVREVRELEQRFPQPPPARGLTRS